MSIDLQIIFSEIAHDHVISMVCTQIDDSSQPICPSETSLSVYSYNSVFSARCRQMKSIFFHYLTFTVGDAPLKCDWPTGVCSYNKDPCPPGTERCSQRDKGCKLDTNYCCCRTNKQTGKLLISRY